MRTIDPTQTTTLRNRFARQLRADFYSLGSEIELWFADPANWLADDYAGLSTNASSKWGWVPGAKVLERFKSWIDKKLHPASPAIAGDHGLMRVSDRFIGEAFEAGTVKAEEYVDPPKPSGAVTRTIAAFRPTIIADRLQVMRGQARTHIEGLTERIKQQVIDRVAVGITRGESPREIGRAINKSIRKVSKTSATRIARTEVIRSFNEAALDRYEQLGITEVGVNVEWLTAGDGRVCPQCRAMEGVIFPVERAHGMLPRHPNCFLSDEVRVLSERGWLPFRELWAGEKVFTHRGRWRRIVKKHKNERRNVHAVSLGSTNSFGDAVEITLTNNHELLTTDGWRAAMMVNTEMYWQWLRFGSHNRVPEWVPRRITHGRPVVKERATLYNLSIEEDESYLIEGGAVVHNCRCSFVPAFEKVNQNKIRSAVKKSVDAGKPKKPKKTPKTDRWAEIASS